MRSPAPIAAAAILALAACDRGNGGNGDAGNASGNAAAIANAAEAGAALPDAARGPGNAAPAAAGAAWDLQSSGEGTALALPAAAGGATAIRLFCAAGQGRLLVNVPSFRPIASEERLSFGGGGDAVALVADPRGDRQRGGVSGTGAVPANLPALLAGAVSASYGNQSSGPHPAVPRDHAAAFARACLEGSDPPAPPPTKSGPASPCLMQGSERLAVRPLRAIGTEPFWGARIEGRCVTYSHPEDQAGTRIWTRYTAAPGGGGTWAGALGGRRFELRIRAQPGCSDGMSDQRYPFAAELFVNGERRTGCAQPL